MDDDDIGDDNDRQQDVNKQQVSIDQVPPVTRTSQRSAASQSSIRATILGGACGGIIKEIERGNENGQIIYEAVVSINSREEEVKIAPDGKLTRAT